MAARKKAKKSAAAGPKAEAAPPTGGMTSTETPVGQRVLDKALADRREILGKLKLDEDTTIKKRFSDRQRVKVEDEEKALLADQLAQVITDRLELNKANAERNRAYREARAGYDEREKELADAVHNSAKFAQVECVEVLMRDKSVRVYRMDTGEQVGEPRAATQEELQPSLFDDDDDGTPIEPTAASDAPPASDAQPIAAASVEGGPEPEGGDADEVLEG